MEPQPKQDAPPTYEQACEEQFAQVMMQAVRRWKRAGKPYKR